MTAKKIILICTTVIISITCFAQENQSITQVLEKKYGRAHYYSSYGGWYGIKKNGKNGACDLQGNEVIPPIWDEVYFCETYYEVKKDGKVGIRDLYNKELIPADKYDEIRYYQMQDYGYCEVEINKKKGILSKDLKEVIPCKYDDIAVYSLKDQPFCEVTVNNKKGVYDINLQKELIPCKYDDIAVYSLNEQPFCKVIVNNKKGFYDINQQKEIIPADKYDEIRYYQMEDYGYCEVEINKKKGILSKDLKEVIPCKYDDIAVYSLKDQPFCEVTVNNKKGVYDINLQKELIPCKYDYIPIYGLKDQPFCEVTVNNKKGFYDINQQKELIPCKYDYISRHGLKEQSFCEVIVNNKKGFYDINQQKEIIPAEKYDEIRYYQMEDYGYCEVEINKKKGILSKDLKEVIPCKYDNVAVYSLKEQPFCKVTINNKVGVYDINRQKEVIPCKCNDISIFKLGSGSFCTVNIDNKCGVVEIKTGKEIIPCQYNDIKVSDENLYTFNVGGEAITGGNQTAQGSKWGVIDSSNKVIIPAEYDYPIVFKDGVAQISKNGIASLLPHPYKGSSLTFANGIANNEVDNNIPLTNKNNKETFAFIIANENYINFSGADYSINDGKIFAEYCKKTLGLPEHNVRYFEDATYGNFVSAIKKIEDIASVYEGEATIIVYYSGLGTIDAQTKGRYILPSDAAPGSLEKTGYSMQKLIEQLDALTTKGTYVLLDAPFTGTDKNGKILAESRGIRIAPKQLTSSGSVLVCFSNSDNENSYASSKYGHGLFTYGILKKLKDNKGNCSWKELLDSSSELVKKESLQLYDKMQTPMYILQESNNNIINKTF